MSNLPDFHDVAAIIARADLSDEEKIKEIEKLVRVYYDLGGA